MKSFIHHSSFRTLTMKHLVFVLVCIVASGMRIPCYADETQSSAFDGLFGMKFGTVMSESDVCETNNVGERAYEYEPATQFRDYKDYVLFATPKTRQVSQIRAVCTVFSAEDADEEIEATIRRLERQFGRMARKMDDVRFIRFDNGDLITVQKHESLFMTKIIVDAICMRLHELTTKEVTEVEAALYERDLKTLDLMPKPEFEDDKISTIESVFGISFGEPFYRGDNPTRNDAGAWVFEFQPESRFMDCEDYRVFATAKTKKVFMIRAIYDGDDDSDAQRKFDQLRRLVEKATGRKFLDNDSSGKNMSLRIRFRDYVIDLEKNWLRDIVMLDFVKVSLFTQNESESEGIDKNDEDEDIRPARETHRHEMDDDSEEQTFSERDVDEFIAAAKLEFSGTPAQYAFDTWLEQFSFPGDSESAYRRDYESVKRTISEATFNYLISEANAQYKDEEQQRMVRMGQLELYKLGVRRRRLAVRNHGQVSGLPNAEKEFQRLVVIDDRMKKRHHE